MAEEFGVLLGGALVEAFDGAGVAGLLPQGRDHPSARGAGDEAATGMVRRMRPRGTFPVIATPSVVW